MGLLPLWYQPSKSDEPGHCRAYFYGWNMCEEPTSPVKRFVATVTSGTASGAVKASPGVAITGMSVYGYPVETWVSVLTCAYLLFMIFGCLPKVVETVLYLYRLARPKRTETVIPLDKRDDRGAMIEALSKVAKEKKE